MFRGTQQINALGRKHHTRRDWSVEVLNEINRTTVPVPVAWLCWLPTSQTILWLPGEGDIINGEAIVEVYVDIILSGRQ